MRNRLINASDFINDYEKELKKERKEIKKFFKGTTKKTWRLDGGWYPICKSRISTESDLLYWIFHLSHKQWMTRDKLLWFIHKVCDDKGFKKHPVV